MVVYGHSSRGSPPPRQLIASLFPSSLPFLARRSSSLLSSHLDRAPSAGLSFYPESRFLGSANTPLSSSHLPTTLRTLSLCAGIYEKVARFRFYSSGPGRERPEPRAWPLAVSLTGFDAKFMRDPVTRITLSVFIVPVTVNFNCSWQPVPASFLELFRSSSASRKRF